MLCRRGRTGRGKRPPAESLVSSGAWSAGSDADRLRHGDVAGIVVREVHAGGESPVGVRARGADWPEADALRRRLGRPKAGLLMSDPTSFPPLGTTVDDPA